MLIFVKRVVISVFLGGAEELDSYLIFSITNQNHS